jgi:hypothetical protein
MSHDPPYRSAEAVNNKLSKEEAMGLGRRFEPG